MNQLCACVINHFSHVLLFETLWTVARQAPLPMGFSRQEYWNGVPFPTLEDLPDPGIEPESLESPTLAGEFFTSVPPHIHTLPWVKEIARGKPLFNTGSSAWYSVMTSRAGRWVGKEVQEGGTYE